MQRSHAKRWVVCISFDAITTIYGGVPEGEARYWTSVNLDVMCDNGIASQNSTINSDIFNATLNASGARKYNIYTDATYATIKMALDVAIESAPLDINPFNNRQNVSSEFCSGSVKTDSFACATKLTLTDIVQLFVAHRIRFIGTQSDGYDGTVEVTGWSCFYTRKLFLRSQS